MFDCDTCGSENVNETPYKRWESSRSRVRDRNISECSKCYERYVRTFEDDSTATESTAARLANARSSRFRQKMRHK
jgi:hypothetical protein